MGIVLSFPEAEKYKLSDLVDTAGFGEICGVQALTIHAYRKKPEFDMPEPIAHIANVPVWHRRQVYLWLSKRPGQGARRDLADAS